MKRFASFLFVALILLNVMGYYGVFLSLQYKHAQEMTQLIEAGAYDPSEMRNFKLPYQSPSGKSSEFFERIDGDFEQEGQVYRLIKQRQYRDTFHIVYMKDKTATAIKDAMRDYVKTFTEKSDGGRQTKTLTLFIKEYFAREFSIQQHASGWAHAIRNESHGDVFIDSFLSSITHPPERG